MRASPMSTYSSVRFPPIADITDRAQSAVMILAFALGASLAVRGDFNRDGRRDRARVVRIRNGYEIVVDRTGGRRQIVYRGDFNDPYVAINHDRGWVRTAWVRDTIWDAP